MKAIIILAAVCFAIAIPPADAAKPRKQRPPSQVAQVTGPDQCRQCLGWGKFETPAKCPYCKGVGSTTKVEKITTKCTRCHGSGKAIRNKNGDQFPCSKCKGSGEKITVNKTVTPCDHCAATGWTKVVTPCPTCGGDGSTK